MLTLILVAAGVLCRPFLWRFATYKAIRRTIEAGDEAGATEQLLAATKSRFFKPDWTINGALPEWRWLRELDAQLFGCPSCRGNWRPLLQYAASQGQTNLVTALLTSGASVNFYGDGGCMALQAAVNGGNTNVIALLLARGANVNGTNFFGPVIHTAAAFSRKPDVIEFLIASGADLSATNANGWTAVDFATVWNTNAIPLLLAHGAVTGRNRRVPLPTRNP